MAYLGTGPCPSHDLGINWAVSARPDARRGRTCASGGAVFLIGASRRCTDHTQRTHRRDGDVIELNRRRIGGSQLSGTTHARSGIGDINGSHPDMRSGTALQPDTHTHRQDGDNYQHDAHGNATAQLVSDHPTAIPARIGTDDDATSPSSSHASHSICETRWCGMRCGRGRLTR